jgi:hypothetical protein
MPQFRFTRPQQPFADDGIVDEVAVMIATLGLRPVRLCPAEIREVVARLAARPWMSVGDIMTRCQLTGRQVHALLAELGYDVLHDMPKTNSTVIVPAKARPAG